MAQKEEETVDTTEEQTEDFDASKFVESDVESKKEDTEEDVEDTTSEDTSSEESSEEDSSEESEETDDSFSWDGDEDDEETEESSEEKPTESEDSSEEAEETQEEDQQEEESNEEEVETSGVSNQFFESLKEKVGIEVKSEEELIAAFEQLAKNNAELQNTINAAGVTNKQIQKLEAFVKLEDEDLVKRDLELNGFDEEQVNKAIETLQDNGTLELEALKIRKNLQNYINQERNRVVEEKQQADAKRNAESQEQQKELKDYLSKTDTMFGFKMAKSEKGIATQRTKHFDYITSGDFFADITKDNQSLAEVAWLWKHRDKILPAMKGAGETSGKRQILDSLENPSKNVKQRVVDSTDKGEFDPNKFIEVGE